MKRVIASVLILVLLLCSCGKPGAAPSPKNGTAPADTDTSLPVESDPDYPAEPDTPSSPEDNNGAKTDDNASSVTPVSDGQAEESETPAEDTDVTDAEAPETEDDAAEANDETGSIPEEQSDGPAVPDEETPAEPYSERTPSTVLTVHGSALEREWYFSIYDLQCMGGAVSADYFSRGKEPQEMTTSFTGILVSYLLEQVIGIGSYKKVTFTASDGYAGSYSQGAVDMSYINEQDPSSTLWMILAWSEDGAPCSLRLVMGQQLEGEYNRTYWVRDVVDMEIRA